MCVVGPEILVVLLKGVGMRMHGTTPRPTPRRVALQDRQVEVDDHAHLEHIYLLRSVMASHELGIADETSVKMLAGAEVTGP